MRRKSGTLGTLSDNFGHAGTIAYIADKRDEARNRRVILQKRPTMMIARILAPAAFVVAVALPAAAQDVAYELFNNSALTVMEFYTSAASTDEWGPDILGSEVIPPGGSGVVTIADGGTECAYDILFVMEDGQELIDTVDVCQLASYTLE